MDPNNLNPGAIPPPQPAQTPSGGTPQPQPGVQPGAPNPYGFIMDTQHKPKKKLIKTGSLRSRIMLIVGAGFILMILIVVVSSIISRFQSEATTNLKSLVAEQQEIIRVAGLGATGSSELLTQSWAETTLLSVNSQQKALIDYLGKNKTVLTKLELEAKLNKDTDATFTLAKTNGNFNDVFTSALKTALTTYAKDIKKNFDNAEGPNSKALLNNSYKSTIILLK